MAYDVFISYRRKGAGAGVAGELQAKLENMGYKVFLDVDEIRSGQFPIQIEKAIQECKDFLLVLSPGTLDRCTEEEDWVRREIIMAESFGKNLIGVMLPGFVMPEADSLPTPLRSLPTKQLFLWSHEYRSASFVKVVENLVSTKEKKVKVHKRLIAVLVAVLLVVMAVCANFFLRTQPEESESVVTNETESIDLVANTFIDHVEKANNLMTSVPTASEFDDNFMAFIENEQRFWNLMDAIAEYDTAMMLNHDYQGQIVDSFGVDKLRNEALKLRLAFMKRIMDDIDNLIVAGWGQYADQDLRIARILATSSDYPVLDSLANIISSNPSKK